jgi:hypothetical protein
MMTWKQNWDETREHLTAWWRHEGLAIGMWGAPPAQGPRHDTVAAPARARSTRDFFTDGAARALRNHHHLAGCDFPADILPISETDIGPGSLALLLGSEPGFSPATVWFEPSIHRCTAPESLPPFVFDPSNPWWQTTEATLRACARLASGKYMVGCPDLCENIDILAALRDPQTLMIDMLERPEWVERKVSEINQVWFAAYQRVYDIIRLPDGSSTFGAFRVWGPGKTAKVQCDASAMFSPEMFRRFVVPGLTEQCEWLDFSLYHLDGTQAMGHLDALLEIEALDAIEWTPQAGIEDGGHRRWFPLYKRILDAGKSVQVVGVHANDLPRLLDAIGGKGVYALTSFASVAEADAVMALVEPYR